MHKGSLEVVDSSLCLLLLLLDGDGENVCLHLRSWSDCRARLYDLYSNEILSYGALTKCTINKYQASLLSVGCESKALRFKLFS